VLALVGALLLIAVVGGLALAASSHDEPSAPKLVRLSPQAQQGFNEYLACGSGGSDCVSHLTAFVSPEEASEVDTCVREHPTAIDPCRDRYAQFVVS
jgi:hypothetical protein